MAVLQGLSGAHAILLATHLCATGNVAALPHLQAKFPAHLPLERVLRIILTFLPESTEPSSYTPVLQALVDEQLPETSGATIDTSPVKDLPAAVVRRRVRKIRLLPLQYPGDEDSQDPSDLLTKFLIHRAHRIDLETALQPLVLDLLLPFYQRSEVLRTWLISSLLPLLRLNYEYYPSQDETFSLDILESMDNSIAINVLLSMTGATKSSMDLVRNLRGLVGAWMYGSNRSKRRRLNEAMQETSIVLPQDEAQPKSASGVGWQQVNEWLLARSLVDHESAVNAFVNWDGPEDVDLGGYSEENDGLSEDELRDLRRRYGQTGLAVVYANADPSPPALDGSVRVLARIAEFLKLEEHLFFSPDNSEFPSVSFDPAPISSASRVSLLQNALLVASNPLTRPSASSISFLSGICLSLGILNELGHPIPCRTAASISLLNNQETQLLELRGVIASVVRQARSGHDWSKTRQQLLWLRDWQADHTEHTSDHPAYHGLFWRVPQDVVEAETLKALLEAKGEHGKRLCYSAFTNNNRIPPCCEHLHCLWLDPELYTS